MDLNQKRYLPIFFACWFGLAGAGVFSISPSYPHNFQAGDRVGFYAEIGVSDSPIIWAISKFSNSAGNPWFKWLPTAYLSHAYFYLEESFTLGLKHVLSMSLKINPEFGIRDLIFPTHFFW